MKKAFILIRRNILLFFKDKGMFFTSLITPAILLILYATFLANIYKNSFLSVLPDSFSLPDDLLQSLVSGQLVSSILAVSCVTVAFCSNFLMVQDKASGTIMDLKISPVKSSVLSLSYYVAAIISTLIICLVATGICLVYIAATGWYLSFSDVLCLVADVVLLVLFGTALSSVVNFFLSSQGQISAVGAIVSAGYGFICGAYMPISSFGDGLKNAVSFLPGTYATSLIRNHSLNGAFAEIGNLGVPEEFIDRLKDSIDCNLSFFNTPVSISAMYLILAASILLLVLLFILINALRRNPR